jgi:hypothetical protein
MVYLFGKNIIIIIILPVSVLVYTNIGFYTNTPGNSGFTLLYSNFTTSHG